MSHQNVCSRRWKTPAQPTRVPVAVHMDNSSWGSDGKSTVNVDVPLLRSTKGDRYVLSAIDHLTRWPEAYAVPDQETETVMDAMLEGMLSRFGVLGTIHADQGRTFESQHQHYWDDHLPLGLMVCCSAVQENTSCTPALLMLGSRAKNPNRGGTWLATRFWRHTPKSWLCQETSGPPWASTQCCAGVRQERNHDVRTSFSGWRVGLVQEISLRWLSTGSLQRGLSCTCTEDISSVFPSPFPSPAARIRATVPPLSPAPSVFPTETEESFKLVQRLHWPL